MDDVRLFVQLFGVLGSLMNKNPASVGKLMKTEHQLKIYKNRPREKIKSATISIKSASISQQRRPNYQ
jgi:hypothetical protein